ncbi:MAG: hypothetical protein ACRDY7_15230 [Acidimicrobiia bacterium]
MSATRLFPVVVLVAAAAGLAGCGGEGAAADPPPVLVGFSPDEVRRVVAEADGQRVELVRERRGTWSPAPGTPPEAAALVFGAEDRLFPLLGYRQMGIEPTRRAFGLVSPAARLVVEGPRGRAVTVLLGAPTFNGAGFYARREGIQGATYLVPRRIMTDVLSVAAGRPVAVDDPVSEKVDRALEQAGQPSDRTEESPWVRQAEQAGMTVPGGEP